MTIPTPATGHTPPPPRPTAPAAPAAPPSSSFGRADADGTVWVRTADGETQVGVYAAGTPEEGLAFFARKYDDLAAEARLAQQRLEDGRMAPDAAAAVAAKVRESLVEPRMVGDLPALASACDGIDAAIEVQRARRAEQRAAAKAAVIEKRERIALEAESLAGSTAWKATSDRFRTLLDDWKALPHGDRGSEQALWKRFSTARSAFDKARRAHFAALEAQRGEAATAKEALIAEAEALSTSTDWGSTAGAYRALTDRWKAAPRGNHRDEDAWWARFRAAQDRFFAARNAASDERDAALAGNLTVKQELLTEAQALLPVTDPERAAKALRGIQARWEAAGHVPRADRDRMEGGLRAVEDAVRSAESERWRRTDPAKRALAESTVASFREALERAEKAVAKAQASGDAAATAKAQESADGTRALLEAAERSLAEYS